MDRSNDGQARMNSTKNGVHSALFEMCSDMSTGYSNSALLGHRVKCF